MKKILIIVLALVVVAVGGAFFVVSRMDPQALRTRIADMSRELTGKPLFLAEAPKISFVPLGVTFGGASWGLEGGKAAEHGISGSVKSGVVSVEFFPLLTGRVVVNEVRLDSPRVTVRPEGIATKNTEEEKKQKKTGEPGALPLELARLNITNGALLLELAKGEAVRIEAFNASIAELRPGAEATVKLDMGIVLESPELKGNISLAGHVRQQGDALTLRQTKLSFTPLGGVAPASLGAVQMALDGNLALRAGVLDLTMLKLGMSALQVEAAGKVGMAEKDFTGSLKVVAEPLLLAKHLGISLPAFPGSGKSSLACSMVASPQGVKLENIKGSLDESSLAGNLRVDLGALPAVQGALHLGALNLDPMLAAENASKGAPAKEKSVSNAAKAILPRVDLKVQVDGLIAQKVALKDVHTVIKGSGGASCVYTLDPVQWTFATGGNQSAVVKVNVPSMQVQLTGKLTDVAVGPLLQALKGSRAVDALAFAEYSLNLNATSAHTMKKSLSGKGSLGARNIVLHNVSALPKGAPVSGGLPTHFSLLNVPFVAQDGIVTINGMALTGEGLRATGKGLVRLPQENVNFNATVTTLGLDIPVTVSGPFTDISYGVDPAWAKNALTRLPGALVEGGKSAGSGAREAGSKLGGAGEKVGGAIKGLFGR